MFPNRERHQIAGKEKLSGKTKQLAGLIEIDPEENTSSHEQSPSPSAHTDPRLLLEPPPGHHDNYGAWQILSPSHTQDSPAQHQGETVLSKISEQRENRESRREKMG